MRVNFRVSVLLTGLSIIPCMVIAQEKNISGRSSETTIQYDESGAPQEILYHNAGSSFRLSEDPSGDYCRLIIPGHHFTSAPGKPELPVYSNIFTIPEGKSLVISISEVGATVLNFSDHKMNNRQIYPSQPERTKNFAPDEKVVIKDRKLYREKEIIRHDTVIVSKVGKFRGCELVNIAIYPAFYNPSKGSVDLITDMKLKISYELSSSDLKSSVAAVINEKSSKAYITGYSDKPVQLVIITDSIFRKALQPLIHWKTMKGMKVTAIYRGLGTADEVYARLKDSLNTIYRNGLDLGDPPQYLMIVGDHEIIPTSRGTINVSDLYYGEFDGSGDYVPDMYTGRLPVSDTTELKAVVKKIIDYESYNYSSSNNFWSRVLVTAGNDAGYAPQMNGQVNYVHGNYFSQDPTLKSFRWFYPQSPLKDDSLKILVNNGLGILNYTGHGEAAGLADPSLKVSNIKGLINTDKYPLIIANACRTAQINAPVCFGKEIVCIADTGAIGYIGCTNDSFWDEDFYWAVGVGTPNMTATYLNTGLGAFDRLFHTHDEEPGEWMYTLGQINFAGNLSVSSSTSSWKKYYWETYMVIGDPSLIPYIGKPDTLNILVPDTLPQTLEELIFFARPFAYAGLSDFDTLWDAKFASPSGSLSLRIPDGAKDSCQIVVTGQNMVPFRKTIYFGQVTDEYLTIGNIINDDSQGNGNNSLDYGEKINLKVTVINLGLGDATNLTATLSVISGLLTIEQGTAVIGTLPGESSYTIDNEFVFNVSDEAADGDLASLLLTLTDDGQSYSFGIDNVIHAPEIKIISSVPNDLYSGNGNYLPDPGEDIRIDVKISNTGSSSTSGSLIIDETSSFFSIGDNAASSGVLDPGAEKLISFEASISSSALPGTKIPYLVSLNCGKYSESGAYSLATGKTRETWEHSRFDVFPWIQSQAYPWTITSSSSYENAFAARSAIMPDNSESILSISLNNPEKDTLSFFTRLSTEATYDNFIFRIDSVEILKVSGEQPWTRREAVIGPGIHYLEWVYRKDFSQTGGFDAVWLDMITFPDIAFLDADLKIDTVFAPPDTALLNDITIRGRVINFGRNTLTSFPLAYRINNGEIVNETFYQKIDPGDTLEIAFTQHCVFKSDIEYNINIINRLPEDAFHDNDSALNTFLRESTPEEGNVRIGPVPLLQQMNIIYNAFDDGTITVEVIDVTGRVVMKLERNVMKGENYLDPPVYCQHLARGVYIVKITEGSRIIRKKVLKG